MISPSVHLQYRSSECGKGAHTYEADDMSLRQDKTGTRGTGHCCIRLYVRQNDGHEQGSSGDATQQQPSSYVSPDFHVERVRAPGACGLTALPLS
jgi:hypothetical protein